MVDAAEGGVGYAGGAHVRLEQTHWLNYNIYHDLVFVFRGDGWSPLNTGPFRAAIADVVKTWMGDDISTSLETIIGEETGYYR